MQLRNKSYMKYWKKHFIKETIAKKRNPKHVSELVAMIVTLSTDGLFTGGLRGVVLEIRP